MMTLYSGLLFKPPRIIQAALRCESKMHCAATS